MKGKKMDKQALIEWALEFPFYRWFYTEKSGITDLDKITYEDVPILEKKFFFEYEEKFGELYYTGIDLSKDSYFERTSGLYLHTRPVILTQEYKSGTVSFSLVEFPKRTEYKAVEDSVGVVNIPMKTMLDPDAVSEYISTYGVNVLADATGHWTHALLEKVPLKDLGIEVILGIIPDPALWDNLLKNFQWCGLYVGADGPGAATCPHCYTQRGVYHPCEDLAEVYVVENGKIKEYGEGLLIINRFSEELFPFIKYTPQDRVKIEKTLCACGMEKYIHMLGRAVRDVRVPRPTDFTIRLDDVEAILSAEGKYLMIYAKVKNEKTIYGEHLALVSFVEKETIVTPELSSELSQKIADVSNCTVPYAVPVILVHEGTFTQIQKKDRKMRKYISVIEKFPPEYSHLVEVARKAGCEIIVPPGK